MHIVLGIYSCWLRIGIDAAYEYMPSACICEDIPMHTEVRLLYIRFLYSMNMRFVYHRVLG